MNKAVSRFLTFLIGVIFCHSQIHAQTSSKDASILSLKSSEIERALATNDWGLIDKLLAKIRPKNVNVCNLESTFRILYGHVALATGKNNIAVEHFYCASDSNNSATLTLWYSWTKKLVERRPDLANSYYFYGDALARMGNLENSKQAFDRCIEIDSKHFLALNARGVIKWLIFKSDSLKEDYELESINDFIIAIRVSPDFADAWANRGVIGLRDEGDLTQAAGKFEKALNVDSTYWLALNGKAVANGASGKYWDFQHDIKEVMTNAPNTPFLNFNTGRDAKGKLLEGSRGASGIEHKFNIGIDFKMPVVTPSFLGVLNIKAGYEMNRGGIFLFLKEGENLIIENDNPRPLGTWFTLNYPLPQIQETIAK